MILIGRLATSSSGSCGARHDEHHEEHPLHFVYSIMSASVTEFRILSSFGVMIQWEVDWLIEYSRSYKAITQEE